MHSAKAIRSTGIPSFSKLFARMTEGCRSSRAFTGRDDDHIGGLAGLPQRLVIGKLEIASLCG